MESEYDVVIVGGGLVGLSLAVSLSNSDLRILLVEAGTLEPESLAGASGFEPRVSAINVNSQRWLSQLGVWSLLPPDRIAAFDKMRAWDADGTGDVSFDAAVMSESALGYIVENCHLQTALMERLSQCNVAILRHTRLSAWHPTKAAADPHRLILDDDTQVSCQLLVGADGIQSQVRMLSGFKVREWDYHHQAIVTTITTTEPHHHTARQSFSSTGPLGILPLAGQDGLTSSIVWSQTPDQAARLMGLSDAAFCLELSMAMAQSLGSVTAVDKRYAIPLQAHLTEALVQKGVALIGDAAHRIHPLAGQGVNLGFADVEALSTHIMTAAAAQLPIGDLFTLRRYQRARQTQHLAMTAAMEGFKRLFEADNIAIRWLRNMGMRQFDQLTPLKQAVMAQAMGFNSPLTVLKGTSKSR